MLSTENLIKNWSISLRSQSMSGQEGTLTVMQYHTPRTEEEEEEEEEEMSVILS